MDEKGLQKTLVLQNISASGLTFASLSTFNDVSRQDALEPENRLVNRGGEPSTRHQ